MMMRLTGRVRSLERRAGENARCRRCGGLGHPDAVLEIDGEFLREPRGCVSCGRLSSLKRIILSSGGDADLADRMRAAWPAPPAARTGAAR